jgi:hypothetical protein
MKFHYTFIKNTWNKCAKFQHHNIITQCTLHKRIFICQLTRSNEQNCFNVILTWRVWTLSVIVKIILIPTILNLNGHIFRA